jgi:hypothetical protein
MPLEDFVAQSGFSSLDESLTLIPIKDFYNEKTITRNSSWCA